MLLITVATENEIKPLEPFLTTAEQLEVLVSGVGPVATAAGLSSALARYGSRVDAVLNIGVAGAYVDSGVDMLDICLARQEFFGDFGICLGETIQDFSPELSAGYQGLLFNDEFIQRIKNILKNNNVAFAVTNFVTVNCSTGTLNRGSFLRDKYAAGCENMEGAAVAMVCKNLDIPCVELRCISNMVEDRAPANWKLPEAITKICRVAETVLRDLL